MTGADTKSEFRRAALARRKTAHALGRADAGTEALLRVLRPHSGKVVAGYMPMRSEIDPLPAMTSLAASGPACVPVIAGKGKPLKFRAWTPGAPMVDGPFGAQVPEAGDWLVPDILILPLVAFDRAGNRLGYGGGFYDRTLERLRATRTVIAYGFAWAAQEVSDLPVEPTDQPLDAIVTETGVIAPRG